MAFNEYDVQVFVDRRAKEVKISFTNLVEDQTFVLTSEKAEKLFSGVCQALNILKQDEP